VSRVVEPKAGHHFTFLMPDRSGSEFAWVRFELALQYRSARIIHLVVDDLNIHRCKSLTDRYGSKFWERFTAHYPPIHGSWLNQAEIEIGLFTRMCLGHRRIPDLKTLRRESRTWNQRINRARAQINWRFDRRAAHRKFGYTKHFSKRSKT
jgi:DDE superfamily endonuclease